MRTTDGQINKLQIISFYNHITAEYHKVPYNIYTTYTAGRVSTDLFLLRCLTEPKTIANGEGGGEGKGGRWREGGAEFSIVPALVEAITEGRQLKEAAKKEPI